mgnify:CR=1 FL=1
MDLMPYSFLRGMVAGMVLVLVVIYFKLPYKEWLTAPLKKKSNCFFFALALYYRRKLSGRHGYIISRRSHWGWFPHFMYARYRLDKTIQMVGYIPKNPRHKRLPPPIFHGKIKWGDQ